MLPYWEIGSSQTWLRALGGRMGPYSNMTGVHKKHRAQGECHMMTEEAETGAMRTAGNAWSSERGTDQMLPRAFREGMAYWQLAFRLPASNMVRQYIFVVSRHPLCSALLQWPRETNTAHDIPYSLFTVIFWEMKKNYEVVMISSSRANPWGLFHFQVPFTSSPRPFCPFLPFKNWYQRSSVFSSLLFD